MEREDHLFIEDLKVAIIENNIDEFVKIIGNNKLLSLDTDYLLGVAINNGSSEEMIKTIIDYSDSYEWYDPIINSNNPEIIRYLLDKMLNRYRSLGDIGYTTYDLAKDGNETAVDVILEFENTYDDAIIGSIEGRHIDMAKKYVARSNGQYNINDIIEVLSNDFHNVLLLISVIPNFGAKDAINVIRNSSLPSNVVFYLVERYNL